MKTPWAAPQAASGLHGDPWLGPTAAPAHPTLTATHRAHHSSKHAEKEGEKRFVSPISLHDAARSTAFCERAVSFLRAALERGIRLQSNAEFPVEQHTGRQFAMQNRDKNGPSVTESIPSVFSLAQARFSPGSRQKLARHSGALSRCCGLAGRGCGCGLAGCGFGLAGCGCNGGCNGCGGVPQHGHPAGHPAAAAAMPGTQQRPEHRLTGALHIIVTTTGTNIQLWFRLLT